MMNYHDKTKGQLIKELQKLQQECDLLKTSYSKDFSEFKHAEDAISRQKDALLILNNFSIGLSKLTLEDNLEAFIVKQLKEITGAGVAVFSEYNQTARTITVKHIEIDSRLLKKAVRLLGQDVYTIHSEVSEEMYCMITSEIIGTRKTLFEATFGAISRPVGAAVQSLLKADRFIGLAYIIEGRLYGTSLLAMSKGQSDPPREILENFISLAAVSLRRKKAEEALRESEARYRLIFENSGDAILLTNPDGSIYSANTAACSMLGYDEKEICKLGRDGLVEQNSQLKTALKRRNESGKFHGELIMIKKGGTRFPVEISSSVFTYSDGRELTAMIIRDITERKIIEDRIKTSEAEYRSLFENSIMGISLTLPDGEIIRINKAYAEMYGYPDTSTMLKEMSTSIKLLYANPDDRERVMKMLDESGYMPPTEFELNRWNGEKFWALVSARQVRDNTGKLLYLQAEHRDITKRKKLEKEMHNAANYSRSLIEASLDPLLTINIDGKISDVNFATEEITGIKREKLIGSDFADYFSRPERARKVSKTVFSKRVVKNYPLTIKHSSGLKTEVLYNATLFKNEAGEIQGVLASARDIADQKRLQSEIKRSKDLMVKLNQHLDEIREEERTKISRDLHDQLGQSLTAIKMDLNMLLRDFPSGSDEVKGKIIEVIERVTSTSIDVQRISSELRPPILDDLGLSSALEWYCEEFGNRSGLNISVALEDVKTDDIKKDLTMYRVLQESLTNIVRHANAGKVWVNLYQNINFIVLSIRDDGIGIPVDRINSSKSFGLLGMSERLKQVKGRLEILSPKKGGTIIRIYMPTTKKI